MGNNEIKSNVQEWLKNQDAFQAQVLEWTHAQGCRTKATWKIREENDNSGSQPVEDVVIDVALKVNVDLSMLNLKIDPIILPCTCHTQKNEDSIRSAVEAINEDLLKKIESIFPIL